MASDGGNPNVAASAEAYVRAVEARQADEAAASRTSAEVWAAFAQKHGLQLASDESAPQMRRAAGVIDDMPVEVAIVKDEDGWHHTLLTVNPRSRVAGVFVAVRPAPTGVVKAMKRALFGASGLTGDPDFDRRFAVRAEPDASSARMLDEEVRSLLLRWFGQPLEAIEYDDGVVYVQAASVETNGAALDHHLAVALRLASWRPEAKSAYR